MELEEPFIESGKKLTPNTNYFLLPKINAAVPPVQNIIIPIMIVTVVLPQKII